MSASRTASGCSAISMWPQFASSTTRTTERAAIRSRVARGGAMASSRPISRLNGAGDLGRGVQSVAVLVAGVQVVVEHARAAAFEQTDPAAGHPHARCRVAADLCAHAVPPQGDHVEGGMVAGLRGAEQRAGDRHGHRAADQRRGIDAIGVEPGGFQGDQGAHAVPGDVQALETERVRRAHRPVRHFGDGAEGLARRTAVARQVEGDGVEAVVREVAALVDPHAVFEPAAVDEHRRGLMRDERARSGVGIAREPVRLRTS